MMHGIAIFLGAFLLFALQPFAGRAILPHFGGGAGVWMTCMLFFQIVLLGGYAYAHGLSGRSLQGGRRIHIGLLTGAIAATFYPLVLGKTPYLLFPSALLRSGGFPALPVLGCLAAGVGLPLLVLSTTSPLVQSWYHRHSGASPYRFYAVSNAGSLGGLLVYPLLLEPRMGLRAQAWLFSLLLLVYAGLIASLLPRGEMGVLEPAESKLESTGGREWAGWAWPAAVGTVLLVAVSNLLASEMASMPLIWVLPLGVYLISFILVFETRMRFDEGRWPWVWMAGLGFFLFQCTLGIASKGLAATLGANAAPVVIAERLRGLLTSSDGIRILGALAGLLGACMVVHGHLGRLKPQGARATSYYLAIATGGALGGLFVSILAPLVFRRNLELPIGAALTGGLLVWRARIPVVGSHRLGRLAAPVTIFAASLLWLSFSLTDRDSGYARDFYGMLRVEKPHPSLLALVNGRTCHGLQFVKDPLRLSAYYGEDSGVARAVRLLQARKPSLRIGVIGLGIGTLAALTRPSDDITFVEISPRDIELAGPQGTHFSVLRHARGRVRVIQGEGRLTLERWDGPAFDLLVIDAFAGGHIPSYLLTEEALASYMRRVTPDGLLVLHVSHHLPLSEQVGANLQAMNFWGVLTTADKVMGQDRFGNQIAVEFSSSYWVLARSPEAVFQPTFFLGIRAICAPPRAEVPAGLEPLRAAWLKSGEGLAPWTDDRNSLAPMVFRWLVH